MFTFCQSIRSKITFGYYAIITAIVVLLILALFELRYMAKEIMFGEEVSELFDTALEIRRFEKNYFLYSKKADFDEAMQYTDRAIALLNKNREKLEAIASSVKIEMLIQHLTKYKELQQQYNSLINSATNDPNIPLTEKAIRQTGKVILDVVEGISRDERKHLQTALYSTRDILVVSIIFLCFTAVALGQVLSRMVVRPLKLLEGSLQTITEGSFKKIYINSNDREIISLTSAINKMLKELELRQRHVVQSEKLASLGTLISGIAHELNNPLSNISTSAEILKEEFEGPDREYKLELIAQIEEQSDRARNIVRSLLEYSRDNAFKREHVSLINLFEETMKFIRGHLRADLSVKMEVPEDIVIFVDKQRIQQAFLNLIKNAIEAISGKGTIVVKATRHSAAQKAEDNTEIYNFLKYRGKCNMEEDTVDIEISDTGSGIPHEIVSKIFDPFFTTKDVGKGSGLGLYIVYEIIEEHDGCIAVDSEPGKGTTFLIRLPIRE